MKILLVTDVFPFPPHKNGNTENIYNILVRLTKDFNYKIDLLYIGKINALKDEYKQEITNHVDNLYLHNLNNTKAIRFSWFLYKKNFGLENKYDYLFFATYLSGFTSYNFDFKCAYILYQADSRTLFYSKFPGLKNKLKYLKARIEQNILFRKFEKIVFVSEIDEKEVNSYAKINHKTTTIPIGCNVSEEKTNKSIKKDIDLIFTGNFHFLPNSDGAEYFLKTITPLLIEKLPQIKIFFVGRFPTKKMLRFNDMYSNNVFVTGEVPSVNDYIERAKIYISPLYKGSGMKNKLLQAMSKSLPIITSIEGTAGFINKDNFLIAGKPEDWLYHIGNLLHNDLEQNKIGEQNYNILTENYTFDVIVKNHFHELFIKMKK